MPDKRQYANVKGKSIQNSLNRGHVLRETVVNSAKKNPIPMNEKALIKKPLADPKPDERKTASRECVEFQDDNHDTGSKITIHVCDETRKINKDFRCCKTMLLSQMKYFEKFQPAGGSQPGAALEDLDISVHCDIQIFEWLMKYLQQPQAQFRTLDTSNAVSILISADYLQMEKLVDECVVYIRDHIHEIIKLPIDTSCIPSNILKKIAGLIDVETLDEEKDRKDKLISKIYMKKLEIMLEDENNTLFRCIYCNKLFTRGQKAIMVCSKANIFIDFHGTVIAEHVADRSWDINKFIHYLRQQGALGWREINWKMWAHLCSLHCSECDRAFVGAEIAHCSFHSAKATFGKTSSNGIYPCCGVPAIRFDTALRCDGCSAKNHTVRCTEENEKILDTLIKRANIIAEPFIPNYNFAEQCCYLEDQLKQSGRLNQQNAKVIVDSLPLSKIDYSPSIQIMMQKYIQSVGESCLSMSQEEDEDECKEEPEITIKEESNNKENEKRRKSKTPIMTNEPPPVAPPPQKIKSWKKDHMRSEDRSGMQHMIGKLKKLRTEVKGNENKSSMFRTENSNKNTANCADKTSKKPPMNKQQQQQQQQCNFLFNEILGQINKRKPVKSKNKPTKNTIH
jgi:hypothetical protein